MYINRTLRIAAAFLLLPAEIALAGDQLIGTDAASVDSFEVPHGYKGNTIRVGSLASGYVPGAKPGTFNIVNGHAEFKLPQVPATRVRSAILQLVRSVSAKCGGGEPVVIDLFAYTGRGAANIDVADIGRGQPVARMQGACNEIEPFSRPVDVSNVVRTAIASGAGNIGFALRPGASRSQIGILYFYGNNPANGDDKRIRLLVTAADSDVAKVEPATPALTGPATSGPAVGAPQAAAGSPITGLTSAFSTLLRGGGSQASQQQALSQGIAAIKGGSTPQQAQSPSPPAARTTEMSAAPPAGGAVAPAPESTTIDADIVGLRLGMSVEDVRVALRNHDQRMKVAEQQAKLANVPGAVFLDKVFAALERRLPVGPADAIGIHFPPPPHKPQVIFINRFTGFEENQLPLVTAIKEALVKKYGTPSFTRDIGFDSYLTWAFSPSGARLIDNSVERKCVRAQIYSPEQTNNVFFSEGIKSDGCGLTIQAHINRNSSGGSAGPLARALAVYMLDATAFPQMRVATGSYGDTAVRESASKVKGPKL